LYWSDESLIWLVTLGFYLHSNLFFLSDNEVIIEERCGGKWKLLFRTIPFTLNHRHVYMVNPFFPFFMAFRLNWLTADAGSKRKLMTARGLAHELRVWALPYRACAAVAFLGFLVAGPGIWMERGLVPALLALLPVYLGVLILSAGLISIDKKRLGLTGWGALSLITELAVCPGYMIGILRRVSVVAGKIDVDGVAFGLANAVHPERIKGAVASRLEDYLANALDDPERTARLAAFKDVL